MKKLFVFLLLGVFLISFTSAFEFDNRGNYNETTKTIIIENALGFGKEIGGARLNTPLDYHVPIGYQKVAEFDLWSYEDYNEVLKNLEFYDKNYQDWDKHKFDRDFDIKYKTTKLIDSPIYDQDCYLSINGTSICENIITGYEKVEIEDWVKVTPADLKKNEYLTIGIFTNVEEGDHTEWIISIYGVEVVQWATWTEDLNANIEAYWKFEEASGTIFDSTSADVDSVSETNIVYGTDGIILNALNYTGSSDVNFGNVLDAGTGAWSVSGWFKSSDTGSYKQIIGKSIATATNSWEVRISNTEKLNVNFREGGNVDLITTSISVTDGDWHFFTATRPTSGGTVKLYLDNESVLTTTNNDRNTNNAFDLVIGETGTGTFPMDGTIDEIGIWNRELSAAEVIQLYNNGIGISYTDQLDQVILNFPENSSTINDPSIQFNWTLEPQSFNITNWTLNVFYSNGTLQHQHINTSININESIDVIHNDTLLLDNSYIWNVEACQTDESCFTASNQTFTLDTAPPVVNITYPPEGFIVNIPQKNITLNYTVFHPVGNLSNCFFNTTSNSTIININCTSNTTSFLYPSTNPDNLTIFVFGNDTAGNLGSDNVTIFKDATAPQINITAPIGTLDFGKIGSNETLNWTVTDEGLEACWYNYNGTNVTVNCSLNTTKFILQDMTQNITFYANDTFSNENSSFTSWDYKIFEINQTFNNVTTEGATEEFTINLVKDSSIQISTINLVYNGTMSSFPYSVSGDEVISQSTITIPTVESDTNVSFYWNITLDDGSDIITNTNKQTILSINVDNCSSFTNIIYNFTHYDEENKSILGGNNTIELQINLFDTKKTTLLTSFSNKFEGVNPVQFCAEAPILTTVNYSAYVIVKYFVNSTDENNAYSVEYYNILNQTIGNTTIPINVALYNLKVSDTTKFKLTFRNEEYVLAPNILVQVHRQYIQDNDFKIVEIPLTDSNGQTVLNLVRNIIIYNFIMVNEAGEVVGTFNSIAAFCSDFSIGDCTINLAPDSLSQDIYDYNEEFDISISSPSYDNSTEKISINFVTGDLTPKNIRMEVVRNNDFGNRSICSDSLFSASGILSCDVSSITDTDQFLFISTFVEDDLAKQDTTNLNSNILNFGTLNGAFYAFFFILILITLFMEDRKILVISLGLGWVGVISLGLINGKFIGFTSAGIWILISIAVFLWKLNSEDSP